MVHLKVMPINETAASGAPPPVHHCPSVVGVAHAELCFQMASLLLLVLLLNPMKL